MFKEHEFANSTCLNCEAEMVEICGYLSEYFGIKYFGYIECYADGTHICLTTDNEWIEIFYRELYQHAAFHKTIDAYTPGILLWSAIENQTTFTAFNEHSKCDHGITLIDKHKNSCEFFTFATHTGNTKIINFYLNNLDILWRHAFYFKDRGATLISKAQADRNILPKCIIDPKDTIITELESINDPLFDTSINPIKRYYVTIDDISTYLTPSEAKCCYYLLHRYTNKQIANILQISDRTVEAHIKNVKAKFACTSITTLVRKLRCFTSLIHTRIA